MEVDGDDEKESNVQNKPINSDDDNITGFANGGYAGECEYFPCKVYHVSYILIPTFSFTSIVQMMALTRTIMVMKQARYKVKF
jgi:hypothetical protein